MNKKRIIVIGGGMAGTAAAFSLSQKGIIVTIIEKNNYLGGRMHSHATDEATFELGAGFISDVYTNTFTFLKQSGLDRYLYTRKSKSAVIRNNTLYPLLSTSVIFGNSILSVKSKLKLIQEIVKTIKAWNTLDVNHMWKGYPLDKLSVSQALQNNNAQELLDYLIQPALDGYCYWSADNTSEAMLRLILKAAFRHHTHILKCGLQRIPETAAKGCDVLLSSEVTEVHKISKNDYEVKIKNSHGTKKLRSNGIVCATTATGISKMIKGLSNKQVAFFSSVHYSSTAIVAKTYNPKITPQNFGIAYPRKENRTLGAITIVSDVTNTDSKKTTLVKLFASGANGRKLCKESDDRIDMLLSSAASQCKKVFDISKLATSRTIQRWEEAIPEFNVGHFHRLKTFMNGEIEHENENVVFAGDYIGGPFIEGAFTSGIEAASRIEKLLSS